MIDIRKHIADSIKTKEILFSQESIIKDIAESLVDALRKGKKIIVAGNGGSAADAQHFAAELVGRFKMERKALPCIAITTDSSIMTAIGNDYDFSSVFSRQVEALGNNGDVFFAISTSGNSENIIKGVNAAYEKGMSVVLLLGKDGGKLRDFKAHKLIVNGSDTARIQECHILIIHILCDYIEKSLFKQ